MPSGWGQAFAAKITIPRRARAHTEVDDADVSFVSETSEGARVVALKQTNSGVEISLVRAGKREVQ